MSILHGDYRDQLKDVQCDAVICDPPYSARTHESGPEDIIKRRECINPGGAKVTSRECINPGGAKVTSGLRPPYKPFAKRDIVETVEFWKPRCSGWICCMTDSNLIDLWRKTYESNGFYAFAPVPCVISGMSVRLSGDGPSSWTVYLMVARPKTRTFASWGTLPGAYTGGQQKDAGGGRGKPAWLMNAIVRDYSKPGDLVCDPFAGWGSTWTACADNRRRFIGAEIDADAVAVANDRNRHQQIGLL